MQVLGNDGNTGHDKEIIRQMRCVKLFDGGYGQLVVYRLIVQSCLCFFSARIIDCLGLQHWYNVRKVSNVPAQCNDI